MKKIMFLLIFLLSISSVLGVTNYWLGDQSGKGIYSVVNVSHVNASKFYYINGTELLPGSDGYNTTLQIIAAASVYNDTVAINGNVSLLGNQITNNISGLSVVYYSISNPSNFLNSSSDGYNKSAWDTAYGWGDHSGVGYALLSNMNNNDSRLDGRINSSFDNLSSNMSDVRNQFYNSSENALFATINSSGNLYFNQNIVSTAGDVIINDTNGEVFRGVRSNAWTDSISTRFFQVGKSGDNVSFTAKSGTVFNRLGFTSSKTQFTTSTYVSPKVPDGIFEVTNGSVGFFNVYNNGNVSVYSNISASRFFYSNGTELVNGGGTDTYNTTNDVQSAINNSGFYNISINASNVQNSPWQTGSEVYNTTAQMIAAVNGSSAQLNRSNIVNNFAFCPSGSVQYGENETGRYCDATFVNSSDLSSVGNWSADKASYNTTAQLNNLYYSISNPSLYISNNSNATLNLANISNLSLTSIYLYETSTSDLRILLNSTTSIKFSDWNYGIDIYCDGQSGDLCRFTTDPLISTNSRFRLGTSSNVYLGFYDSGDDGFKIETVTPHHVMFTDRDSAPTPTGSFINPTVDVYANGTEVGDYLRFYHNGSASFIESGNGSIVMNSNNITINTSLNINNNISASRFFYSNGTELVNSAGTDTYNTTNDIQLAMNNSNGKYNMSFNKIDWNGTTTYQYSNSSCIFLITPTMNMTVGC